MVEIDVSNGQNNLYRELLDYANDEHKLDDLFPMKNSALLSLTGLSESGIKKARNELAQMGLIKYVPGRKNSTPPKYRIIKIYQDKDTVWATKAQKSSSERVEEVAQTVPQTVAQTVAHKELTSTDYDKTNKKKSKKKPVPVRHEYGEYKNVLLTDADFDKLKTEFPKDWQQRLNNLSEYMETSGKRYKNHLATIRVWAKRDKSKLVTSYGRKSFESSTVNDSFDDDDLPF